KNTGAIIYDNQPGASDAALPTLTVGNNSSIVISGTNSSLTSSNTSQKVEMEATTPAAVSDLEIIAYPNPGITGFSIIVKGDAKEKIVLHVIDMNGKMIETRNVNAHSLTKLGENYRPGVYIVRIMQGQKQKEIKLVKLAD